METARWTEIKDRLADALDHEGPAREAFLQTLDPDTGVEVRALLRAAGEEEGVLEHPPTSGGVADELFAALHDEPDLLIGTEIGPYHVEERIGQGGMGDVYRARRADGLFDREVALKVVRRGAEIGSVLSRFASERRILGRLRHPGIARLLDAGIDGGRPWIAMDYVRGEPITEVARGLPVAERVRLLIAVAEAVHTAHQSLVVHRDLKPSNVLVSRDASGGLRPVLLDFGIAKILDPDDDDDLTRVDGRRPMTHTYAAPEQIRGEAPTTATDVYGLGLLAYEVLCGERPFPDRGSRTQLEQAVLHDDPAPPSTASGEAPQPGAASGAAPEARALRGDLDTICLKALRKEPAERYASAEAFAADLRRHLGHLPIEARPPSARYRVARFVRRHRVGVAATAAAMLATVALSAIYATSLAAERDRARTEAETAEQVAELMVQMFDRDPFAVEAERLDTLRVGTFLVQRGNAVIDGLGDQPRVQARLATLLSHLHIKIGEYEAARPLAQRAVSQLDSLGARGSDASEAYTALAAVHSHLGEYDDAERTYRTALALAEQAYPPGHPATAEALRNLAHATSDLRRDGALDDAIEIGTRALEITREALGPDHLDVAQAHNNLGAFYYDSGQGREAVWHFRRALRIREAALGDHPLVANTLSNLANIVHDQGEPEEAIPLFERAIRIWSTALGPEHPALSTGYYGLGYVYRDLDRLADAEAAFRAALAIDSATLPPGHPYLVDSMISIAQVQMEDGRYADAEGLLRRAIGLMAARDDTPEAERAVADAALGLSLLRQRRPAAAVPLLRGALPHLDDDDRERVSGHLSEALAAR